MDIGKFRGLVTFTAECLTGQHQGKWTVTEVITAPYSPQALLDGPDHAQLKISMGWGMVGKVRVCGMMPSKYGDRHEYGKGINVAPERGGKTIANEARRRVLDAGYLDELPAKVAEWQTELAEADTRIGIMARAAGLFGLEAPGDAPLNLSRFLPNKRGQAELSSYGKPEMSIELYGLDPEVGMAMLQVMAASHLVHASCCHRYGPGHHPQFEVTGCLRESSERGEQASAERVYTFLTCSRGLDKARVSLALTDARTSRYQVAEVMRGDDVVAVVSWNTGGLGEYTVEIPRKDATS